MCSLNIKQIAISIEISQSCIFDCKRSTMQYPELFERKKKNTEKHDFYFLNSNVLSCLLTEYQSGRSASQKI